MRMAAGRPVWRYNEAMQVTVEIPADFLPLIVPNGADAGRKLLEDTVAQAYRERRLSMEQVRQILGFGTRMEVDPFLQKYEIYDYTVDDLEHDLKTMEKWMAARRAEQSK
jgi:hypothetical protein